MWARCRRVAHKIRFVEDLVGFPSIASNDIAGKAEDDDGLGGFGVGVLRFVDFCNLTTYETLEVCATAIPTATVCRPELICRQHTRLAWLFGIHLFTIYHPTLTVPPRCSL